MSITPAFSVLVFVLALLLLGAVLVWMARWSWGQRDLLGEWARGAGSRLAGWPPLRPLIRSSPRLGAFLQRRFSPGEYLGLHLTLGLAISVAALVAFGALAKDLLEQEELSTLDLPIANWLHAHASGPGVAGFGVATWFGSVPAIVGLTALVAIVLAVRRHWIRLAGWLAAVAGGGALVMVLKGIFQRPRPSFADPFVYEPSYSFPSGHSLGSIITYGMLTYLVASRLSRPSTRGLVICLGFATVLAIGFSRLYLGAHYLTDVLSGYAAGLVWLTTCITAVEAVERFRARGAAAPRMHRSSGSNLRKEA